MVSQRGSQILTWTRLPRIRRGDRQRVGHCASRNRLWPGLGQKSTVMGTYQGTFYFSGHQKSECPLVCPISKAFDEVPAFQGNYVKGQRERVLTDIFDRVKEKVSSGICNGSLRYTIASKDIGKTSLWGSGLLGYELATPHRVDAKHEITVAWRQTGLFNETAINYQVASTYEW